MPDRRRFWSGVITALVFFSAVLLIGALIGSQGRPTRGEWMGFAGSIIGSGLTVLGALLVFEWQQHRETTRQWRMINDQLVGVLQIVGAIKGCAVTGRVRRLVRLREYVTQLKIAWESLKDSRRWVTPRTVHTVEAFAWIDRIKVDIEAYERVLNLAGEMEATGDDENAIDDVESRIREAMAEVEFEVMGVQKLYKKGN